MSHLPRQSGGTMRRSHFQQGQLGEVPVPKLGQRGVIQVIDPEDREKRECEAGWRLHQFREKSRQEVAYRLLREARRRHPRQKVGLAAFFDLTARDEGTLREALALVGPKLGDLRLSCLLLNEETHLEDARGPIHYVHEPGAAWQKTTWTERNVNLAVIFVPVGFGDHESLVNNHDESSGIAREKLAGRANLILFLVARAYICLWGPRAPRRVNRLLKSWGLRGETSPEQYASQLLDAMREP